MSRQKTGGTQSLPKVRLKTWAPLLMIWRCWANQIPQNFPIPGYRSQTSASTAASVLGVSKISDGSWQHGQGSKIQKHSQGNGVLKIFANQQTECSRNCSELEIVTALQPDCSAVQPAGSAMKLAQSSPVNELSTSYPEMVQNEPDENRRHPEPPRNPVGNLGTRPYGLKVLCKSNFTEFRLCYIYIYIYICFCLLYSMI